MDPIDPIAFIVLASSYINRLKVPTCRWWELIVLHQQCLEHLDVTTVCLATILGVLTTLQQCVQVGTRRWRDDDDSLDHYSSRRCARSHHSAAPGGGWTAQGGGLTASLCVRQAVPGYRDTQRCTRNYLSTATSLFICSWSLIEIVSPYHTSTSQRRHLQWTRLLLRALQVAITTTLMIEPSTSEPSPIKAVAQLMPIHLHQAS
jgi:hypothetical protein